MTKELNIRKANLKPAKRPRELQSSTTMIQLGCKYKMYVTITVDDKNNPMEIFASAGKGGCCLHSQLNSLCRILSIGLRSGVPVKYFSHSLRNIQCDSVVIGGAKSCGDGIAQVLETFVKEDKCKVKKSL